MAPTTTTTARKRTAPSSARASHASPAAAAPSSPATNAPLRSPTAIVSTNSASCPPSHSGVLGRFRDAFARHTKSASSPAAGPLPATNASMSSLPLHLPSHRRHHARQLSHPLGPHAAATGGAATSAVFGVPLSDSVRVASAPVPDGRGTIIPFVVLCIGTLLKAHAVQVEGVFRKVGSQRRMRELQAEFERAPTYGRQLDFGLDSPEGDPYYTVHDAACVLRRYLTSLPDPLVPRDLWMGFRQTVVQSNPEYYDVPSAAPEVLARPSVDNWTAASTASGGAILAPTQSRGSPVPSSTTATIAPPPARTTPEVPSSSCTQPPPPEILPFRQLLDRCPQVNRDLILYLLELLAVFAMHHETNFMTAANLAVIFQPSFFNHPSLLTHPEEHKLAVHALELLILYHGALRPASSADAQPPTHVAEETNSNDALATPATLSAPASFPPTSWQGALHSTAYLAASASLSPLYRSPYPPSRSNHLHPESVARTSTTTPTTITTTSTEDWDRRRRPSEHTMSTYASASMDSTPSALWAGRSTPSVPTTTSAPSAQSSAQPSLPAGMTASPAAPASTRTPGVRGTSPSNAKPSSPLAPKGPSITTRSQLAKPPRALPFLATSAPPSHTRRPGPKARIISVDSPHRTQPTAIAPPSTSPQLSAPTTTAQPSSAFAPSAPLQQARPAVPVAQLAPPVRSEGSTARLLPPVVVPSRPGSTTTQPESRSTSASLSIAAPATAPSTPGTPTTPPEPDLRPKRTLSRRKRPPGLVRPNPPAVEVRRKESWTSRLGRHLFGKKHEPRLGAHQDSKDSQEPSAQVLKGPPPQHEPKHLVQAGIPFPPVAPPRGSSISAHLPPQRSSDRSSSNVRIASSLVRGSPQPGTRDVRPSASSVVYVGKPTLYMAVSPGTDPVALDQDSIPIGPTAPALTSASLGLPSTPPTPPVPPPPTAPAPAPTPDPSVPASLPTPKEELQDASPVPATKREVVSTASSGALAGAAIAQRPESRGPSRSGSNRSNRSIGTSRSTSCRSHDGSGVSRSASHRSTHSSSRRPTLPSSRLLVLT